ncbi:MAG: hypothetical protein ABL974_20095 [Prosthecobacter sp.]
MRVAASQFPVASALVQLHSELDSDALLKRVKKLEDPISFLHEDVPAVSRIIYEKLKSQNSINLSFEDEFYTKYSRSLAALASKGYVKSKHCLGSHLPFGVAVIDHSYTMYLCALFEDAEKMEYLIARVDQCEIGEWLDGNQIFQELQLPLPVVRACFGIYESKGYGLCSREIGRVSYCGNA